MPTPKLTTAYRQNQKNLYEMPKTFESFRWLLKENLETQDMLLTMMRREAATLGVSKEYYEEYVTQRLDEMMKEIIKEREARERAKRAKAGEKLRGHG